MHSPFPGMQDAVMQRHHAQRGSLCSGGHLVIVNLQRTPKDKHAALLVRAKCDYVMAGVMHYLQWSIPAFIRNDAILLRHTQPRPGKRPPRKDGEQIQFRVEASSVHGAKCPLPMITEAKLSFPVGVKLLCKHPQQRSSILFGPANLAACRSTV